MPTRSHRLRNDLCQRGTQTAKWCSYACHAYLLSKVGVYHVKLDVVLGRRLEAASRCWESSSSSTGKVYKEPPPGLTSRTMGKRFGMLEHGIQQVYLVAIAQGSSGLVRRCETVFRSFWKVVLEHFNVVVDDLDGKPLAGTDSTSPNLNCTSTVLFGCGGADSRG